MIDIIDFRNLSQHSNKVTNVVFSDMGEAFATVDTAGHIVVFYVARDKFVNVCRVANSTAMFLTEKNHGMLFLGMADYSIQVYNLGKYFVHKDGDRIMLNLRGYVKYELIHEIFQIQIFPLTLGV